LRASEHLGRGPRGARIVICRTSNTPRHASFPRGDRDSAARSSVAPACGYLGWMPQARRRRQVSFRRWRVLVVEDDDSFAEALRELLEGDGRLEVAGRARDGREGVELAEALRPDVVLMDIVLPVLDGVEATREIRRRQPSLPVVGIRARAVNNSDAGRADYLKRFYGISEELPTHYDLVVNTDAVSVEQAAGLISLAASE
jgi:CheY-like chemotaxis protein